MELVIVIFTIISSLVIFTTKEAGILCKNNDIVDIYYTLDKELLAYDAYCPFTKTLRNCTECGTYYISRNHYTKIAESYTKLGMEPPFPKRTDIDNLHKPYKNY